MKRTEVYPVVVNGTSRTTNNFIVMTLPFIAGARLPWWRRLLTVVKRQLTSM